MQGLRERIKAGGWRQGSILPPELCSRALEQQGITPPGEPLAFVILTQDCDLLADKLDVEPDVEVILGTGPIQSKRQLDRSNRQILIRVSGPNEQGFPGHLQFRDKHRIRIPREWLVEHRPHDSLALATTIELRLLLNLVVRRFDRPALSDAFNLRLAPAFGGGKKGQKLLKQNRGLFRELRWSAPRIMEELPEDEAYKVQALTAILEPDANAAQAQESLEEIQELIREKCPGIDMGNPDSPSRLIIRRPEHITLADYEALLDRSEPWDWEWLSRPINEATDSDTP